MKIKFLKAGEGDSILISYKKHNILVDGGNDSTFLLKEINLIRDKGEVIDLMVITHHDDDHIQGIEDLLNHIDSYSNRNEFIKQILFNSPRVIQDTLYDEKDPTFLSYYQAYKVENLIKRLNLPVKSCTNETSGMNFENLNIEILSPTKDDLDKYSSKKGAYLSSDDRCDWSKSLASLEKFLDDDNLDTDLANKTSIVLNISADGRKVLLTGDVTPSRLNCIIDTMYINNNNEPVYFDLIKLPHHGSYRNLTENILKKINCSTFVISTDGKNNFLPNKRALLKVVKHIYRSSDQPIELIFNYEAVLDLLKITEEEQKYYNFKIRSLQNEISWH